jgi:hypothetical protein
MTGGAFNGGSGDITATGPGANVQSNGASFKSTSGTLFVGKDFRMQSNSVFDANGGTVVLNQGADGPIVSIVSDDVQGHFIDITFNNVVFNKTGGTVLLGLNTMSVNGSLAFTDGPIDAVSSSTIKAFSDVSFSSTFDGLTNHVTLEFAGSACQTVTLAGVQNFPGLWRTNKTGCGITANGSFGVGSISVPSGSFVFGNGSQANIVGNMTIDPNGRIRTSNNSAVNVVGNVNMNGGDLNVSGNNSTVTYGAIDVSGAGGDLNVSGDGNNMVGGAIDVSTNGGDLTINVSGTGNVIDANAADGNLAIDLDGTNNTVDSGAGQIGGSIDLSGTANTLRFDSLTIEPGGRLTADSPGTIIFGGDVVNNGLVNLHGFGSECIPFGGANLVIQSSVPGTRRSWSGSGVFRIVHVNVSDMGGTVPILAHNSGTTGGNNGPNWTLDTLCPPNVLHTAFDFDGDSRSDVAIFRSSTNEWWTRDSTLGARAAVFGNSTDKLTPADFDGDGLTDIAIWREGLQSKFFIFESSTYVIRSETFGVTGDDPRLVADWDGDGIADPAVYRPGSQGTFFYLGSANNPNHNITFVPWGVTGDKAARGDFDGDGKADAAIFRPSDGNWWVMKSSNGAVLVQHWGISTDKPVDGDFDGDGKSDFAVFRPSEGNWYVLLSSNGQVHVQPFGLASDKLTPGDYDGDGKTDFAIWRPSTAETWILSSSNSAVTTTVFGFSSDVPIGASFTQ